MIVTESGVSMIIEVLRMYKMDFSRTVTASGHVQGVRTLTLPRPFKIQVIQMNTREGGHETTLPPASVSTMEEFFN